MSSYKIAEIEKKAALNEAMIKSASANSSEVRRRQEISKRKEELKQQIVERVSELQRITELKNGGEKIFTDKVKRTTANNVLCIGGASSKGKSDAPTGPKNRPKSSYLGS